MRFRTSFSLVRLAVVLLLVSLTCAGPTVLAQDPVPASPTAPLRDETWAPMCQRYPWAVAVDPAVHRIFITDHTQDVLVVLDDTGHGLACFFRSDGQHALAVNTVTHKVYVASSLYGTVFVHRTAPPV